MTTHRVPVLDEFSWQPPVLDKDLTAPPGGEAKGDRYIVGGSATGAWSGLDNHIVTYDGAAWLDATPAEGWYVYVDDENALYRYTGAAWDIEDISAVESNIVTIETTASVLQTSVTAVSSELDTVESEITTIETVASVLQTSVTAVSSELDTVESEITTIETVASVLQTSVTAISSNVDTVETTASVLQTSVTGKQDLGTYVSAYGAIEFTI